MSDNGTPATIVPPKAGLVAPPINRIQCELCSKSFGRKGDWRRHLGTHTGDKPHVCHFCNKAFGQKSGLLTHVNTHTGAKPYECKFEGCTAKFGDPSSCARHKKETHRVKHPYRCCHPGCVSSIKRRSAFKNHLRKHNIDPDEVDIDAMARPKKSTPSRRKAMPSPRIIVPPAPASFLHFPEPDTKVIIEPTTTYGSLMPSPTRYDTLVEHHPSRYETLVDAPSRYDTLVEPHPSRYETLVDDPSRQETLVDSPSHYGTLVGSPARYASHIVESPTRYATSLVESPTRYAPTLVDSSPARYATTLVESPTRYSTLVESPTRYNSQSPHHTWYEPSHSVSAAPKMPEPEHYTEPIGSAGFYRGSVGSAATLVSYDNVQPLDDDSAPQSPSRLGANYSLWSGSTLVGDEYYNTKDGSDFPHKDDFGHKGDYAHKADYAHKGEYILREEYAHSDSEVHKNFYYHDSHSSPAHAYPMKHMSVSEPVPAYHHHVTPGSSPPPYGKITIPRLDTNVTIASQDDSEHYPFAASPSKIYGSMSPPKYAHEQEKELAANGHPAQWTPPPAWQY